MPTVPSIGPPEISSFSPVPASEPTGGRASFGQILNAMHGSFPAPSADPADPRVGQLATGPAPPATVPAPPEPVLGIPAPTIQRIKTPANQKSDGHPKKPVASSSRAPSGDSAAPVPVAPVPVPPVPVPPVPVAPVPVPPVPVVPVPMAPTPMPEPIPPPTVAVELGPPVPPATGLSPVSGRTSPRTINPAVGQEPGRPAPIDRTSVPDTSGALPEMKPLPVIPGIMKAGTAVSPANSRPLFQVSDTGAGNAAAIRGGTPPAGHPQLPPLHPVAGAPSAGTQTPADHKAPARTDTVTPSARPGEPAASGALVMAEPPVQPSVTQSATIPTTAAIHPAMPAAQIAPALLTLAKAADGTQQMTVRLNPDQLGMVQIRLDRAPSGTTQVQILADRPETLHALQRDQPALNKSLDDAGIASAGRTIVFHSTAHPAPQPATSNGSSQGGASHTPTARSFTSGQGGAQGGTQGETRGGSKRGGHPAWGGPLPVSARAGPGSAAGEVTNTTIYRVGLNITA